MSFSRIKALTLFLFAVSALNLYAQEFKAELFLNKEEIKIGEHVEAILTVSFPVTDHVVFAVPGDTLIKAIEIIERFKIDTNYIGNKLSVKTLSQKYILTCFDTGYHTIPPIWFYGDNDSVRTHPSLLFVVDVPVEMSQNAQEEELEIKDIKNIVHADFSIWEWFKLNWYWVLSALLLIIGIWIYIKYIHPKFKDKGISIIPKKKLVPAHIVALTELKTLKSKKLWQNGKVKPFHIELSDIVRKYIENGLNIQALESTTDELFAVLNNSEIPEEAYSELQGSLKLADLVKFAKLIPLGDENERCYSNVLDFINKTKPVEEENTDNKSIEKTDYV